MKRLLRYGIQQINLALHFRTLGWKPSHSQNAKLFSSVESAGYDEMLKHDFFKESVLDDVEGAGYAVGFYFWEQLAREHGRDFEGRLAILERSDRGNSIERTGCQRRLG